MPAIGLSQCLQSWQHRKLFSPPIWDPTGASQVAEGKESTCHAGGVGSIPRLGRSLGAGDGSPSRILAWRIPWTEEPGGPQSMESRKS